MGAQVEQNSNKSVASYRKMRDFRSTPEPRGKADRRSRGEPIFVIQHHEATSDHFDFRIEAGGVLKSWAVPKGPSTDPGDKRLAIPTEDHPLEYADFEGVIPEGCYGAGVVQIWDRGTYRNITQKDGETRSVDDALADGHLLIELDGKKIKGGYALHRTGKGGDARWLLVKTADDAADARRNPVSTEKRSVESGRTMREIARDEKESSS